MSVRWASMHPWSMSTPMINLALRLGKQRRPNCCNFKSKCARNSRLVPASPPKKLRGRSMRTPKTCFMCCGTWRAMIRTSGLQPAEKSSTRDFQSTDSNFMATAAPLNRTDALAVPWTDALRFIRQLSHDLRNHLNAIELQSAYISEFEVTAETKAEIDRGKGALLIACKIDRNRLVFTIREPKIRFKSSTHNWGREPLRHITHGHYGLGLYRVRAIMEAHGGDMRAQYDATGSELVTTLILPLPREES